jgi:signal transduction histidine kinase
LLSLLGAELAAASDSMEAIAVDRSFHGPLRIGTWLDIFEDKSATLPFREVVRQPFVRSTSAVPNFGFTRSAFWSRFVIENLGSETKELILVHQYVQTDWVELYVPQGESYHKILNGDNAGAKDSEATVEYIRSSFHISAPPGRTVYYVRTQSQGVIQLDFALWSVKGFYTYMPREYLVLACFFGILFVMSFYNLFLYFMIQDASYLFYVLFTASYALTSILILGFGNVFFPEMIFLNNEVFIMLTSLALSSSFRFSVTYLDLVNQGRIWYRIGLFLEIVIWFACLAVLFHYPTAAALSVAMSFTMPLYLISVGYWLSWKRDRNAYFYSLAWTTLLIFSVYRMLGLYGVVEKNLLTEYGQNLGSVLELVILSLGVGDKMRRARQEAVQQKMEAQRRLRSSLQTRFVIVSNLAHRMNNPLNYIQTGVVALVRSIDLHRRELVPLLPGEDNRTAQENTVCETLIQRLDEMEDMLMQVQLGVNRSSQSINEIRSLSGIDGHHLERLRLTDVIEEARRRLEEFRGLDEMKRLTVTIHDDASCLMACNRYALSIGMESLLREILEAGTGNCHVLCTVWPSSSVGLTRVHIQLNQPIEGYCVSFLADLLTTYGVTITGDMKLELPSFELLIPTDIDRAAAATKLKAS